MAASAEEKSPLIKRTSDESGHSHLAVPDDIPLQSQLSVPHCHVPDDKFDRSVRNRLIIVLILCTIFMVIEIVGGVLSNSTAVITDAAHMCIDAASFLTALAALYLGRKRPTKRLSFGYIRAEVLAALLSVIAIWIVAGVLVYFAIRRCIDPSFQVDANVMLVVASCAVVFNIIMFLVLHSKVFGKSIPHGHSHGESDDDNHGHSRDDKRSHSPDDKHSHSPDDKHSHSPDDNHGHSHDGSHGHSHDEKNGHSHDDGHGHSEQKKKLLKNINIQAATIHVIGDFVQSIGVLIAAIIIKIKPEYKLADPICTFIFSILVLITTITIMRDIVLILMEGVPRPVNYTHVVEDLLQVPGVCNTHSLHVWSLSMHKTALSVHLAIANDHDYSTVLNAAQQMLRHHYSITQTAIQIEPYDENIMNSCDKCQPVT